MGKKSKVKVKILAISAFPLDRLPELFNLFNKYYEAVSLEQFEKDFLEKTHVFLLTDKDKIIGFSTIKRHKFKSFPKATFMFSGDTVVDQDYWGSKGLQKAFFYYIVQSKLLTPTEPLYWCLISKGHKTYLMMKRNFKESFPDFNRSTPNHFLQVQNDYYRNRYGDFYQLEKGLIIFPESKGQVLGDIAHPDEKAKLNPHVQHFLKLNPNFFKGEELACMAEIRFSDFTQHISKYILPKF